MEKISGVPNWIQNKGFCPYLKFVSLVFLNIAQDCSLGQWLTSSRVESSKNNIVTQIVGEMIFSVLMSSSIHSNLLVITNIVIFSGSIISVTNIILFYVLISFKVNSFIILFYFWTLDVSRTGSYEIALVRLSVCQFVVLSDHPSLSFLKFGSLFFSDILPDDSWPWYLVTYKLELKKKKIWSMEFEPNWPKLGSKLVFFWHFLKFGAIVFLEIAYNDILEQCLTSSRGKIHEKNLGAQTRPKSGPKLGFLPFLKVWFIIFLWNCIQW